MLFGDGTGCICAVVCDNICVNQFLRVALRANAVKQIPDYRLLIAGGNQDGKAVLRLDLTEYVWFYKTTDNNIDILICVTNSEQDGYNKIDDF